MKRLGTWLGARLKGGRFERNLAVLAGGSAAAQAITVLLSPLQTRLYSPADYGMFGVFSSLLAVLGVPIALRYELAIPAPRGEHKAATVLVLALTVGLTLSVVAGMACGLFGPALARAVGSPTLAPYLWLLGPALALTTTYAALNYWAVRHGAYPIISRTRLSQAVGGATVTIGSGLAGLTPLGLFLGNLVSQGAGIGSLGRFFLSGDPAVRARPTRADLRACAREYRDYARFSAPASLLNSAGLYATPVLLSATLGPAVAGLYGVGQRALVVPFNLVGAAVAQIFFSEASRVYRERPADLGALFDRTTRRLLVLGLVPAVLAMVAGPLLFGVIFGERWHRAGIYVAVLVPLAFSQFLVSPVSMVATVCGRQRVQLILDALRLVTIVAAVLVPHALGLDDLGVVAVFSGAGTLMYGAYFVAYRAVARSASRAATMAGAARPSP